MEPTYENNRTIPNFLVTGTPGVGKTTLSSLMATTFNLTHYPISRLIEEKHLYSEVDAERDCTIYNDEMLDDEISEILKEHSEGGVIFDFHCSDIVNPEDVDAILVLRTTSDILWKRLQERGYSEAKIRENTEAEIFRVILDEVLESFDNEKVIEITSDSLENLDEALEIIRQRFFSNT